jgi:hypothetical protein
MSESSVEESQQKVEENNRKVRRRKPLQEIEWLIRPFRIGLARSYVGIPLLHGGLEHSPYIYT